MKVYLLTAKYIVNVVIHIYGVYRKYYI